MNMSKPMLPILLLVATQLCAIVGLAYFYLSNLQLI